MQKLLLILIFLLCFEGSLIAHAENSLKVAFIRGDNLWIKIGDKETQITDHGNAKSPVWSHDAKWIAYSKQGETPDKSEIWAYNTKTKKSYLVFHGFNFQWAPDKNLLAYQPQIGINLTDLRGDKPARTYGVAQGVDNFSWMPDGKGFLASANACPRPDGWTNPVLYKIKLEENHLQPDNVFANAKEFFTIPGTLKKNNIDILSIGTSEFKWSPDKKWISFLVNPTASWSMDSNMLCTLSSDGKKFEPLDEMALEFPFDWAPTSNVLGYIQGGGRIVFGFKNKNLKVKELPALQSLVLTPKHFVDLSFTWQSDRNVIVSRSPELKWSNQPSKKALPILFRIDIQNKDQKQLSFPPVGYGDFNPKFLYANQKLTWTRSNWEKNDVWISEPDGKSAKKWIENVDDQHSVSWYAPVE